MHENHDTTIDAPFCGLAADPSIKCWLHLAPCIKYVAFEGINTRRRFCGYGIDCGVAEWVDAPWPSILQRCLVKLWEMFHEENCGKVMDHEKHKKEMDKTNKQLDKLVGSTSHLYVIFLYCICKSTVKCIQH
ncbi:hypothetical protein ZWY2020_005053 [Hordeum vulgare]|nr:hypothetical protein ZWY2020_005053 [Hordeum vulgare]